MKPKNKPVSKIPTTQKNTNQKKKEKNDDSMDMGGSLLKKNEFTLIIAGALVVTLLVFFLFFRSSDSQSDLTSPGKINGSKIGGGEQTGLGDRISTLELAVSKLASSPSVGDLGMETGKASGSKPASIASIEQRVARLETTVTIKIDSLIGRMGKMEKQVASLKKRSTTSTPAVKTSKTSIKKPVKTPTKKKVVQTEAKKSLFHTVQKGETLWSISQKYKTSVAAIRKLNNLAAKDDIYPGNNILVR